MVAAFGGRSLPYALSIAAAVAGSYVLVEWLLRRAPETLLARQLALRLLDAALVCAVLTGYHAFLQDAYYDAVYVLFVVAAAATHGRRGALTLALAAGAGVLASRLVLLATGVVPFSVRQLTDCIFFGVFFLVVGLAVAFLMQRSGEAVERREAAFRETLARRNARLEELATERDRALVEAQDAMRARDEFLAAASHDLKNPLTVMLGSVQAVGRYLEKGDAPLERLLAGVRRIENAAMRMHAQLDEMVETARSSNGQQPAPELAPVDLVALVRQSLAAHQPAAGDRELRLVADEEQLVAAWDAVWLGRVLDNLLSNAIKYSPEGVRSR